MLYEVITPKPRWAIVDFRRVHGMDVSTAFMLGRMAQAAHRNGVQMIFTRNNFV